MSFRTSVEVLKSTAGLGTEMRRLAEALGMRWSRVNFLHENGLGASLPRSELERQSQVSLVGWCPLDVICM
jgi:hypothetical protein